MSKNILAIGLLILCIGGIFAWQYWLAPKEEVAPEVKKPLEVVTPFQYIELELPSIADLELDRRLSIDSVIVDASIDISGNYLYVADGWSGLRIIDISNPLNSKTINVHFPEREEYTQGNQTASDVKIIGNYAYVLFDDLGLKETFSLYVLDISQPHSPKFVGEYSWKRDPKEIYAHFLKSLSISNNRAFIHLKDFKEGVFDRDYIRILDISNPYSPRKIGDYFVPNLKEFYVSNNILFAVKEDNTLSIINLQNFPSTQELAKIIFPGKVNDIVVVDDDRYIYAIGEKKLYIIDIKDLQSPKLINTFAIPTELLESSLKRIHLSEARAFIINFTKVGIVNDLFIFDITDPPNPQLIKAYLREVGEDRSKSLSSPGLITHIYYSKGYIYLSFFESGGGGFIGIKKIIEDQN